MALGPARRQALRVLAGLATVCFVHVLRAIHAVSHSSPARWHADIVDRAVASCRAGLAERGFTDVDVIEVPGAFEIPLRAKRLASTGRYAALAGR